MFGANLNKFPTKHSQKTLQLLKNEVFWKKLKSSGKKLKHFEKNSSFLALKLNEPVVTNYTPATIKVLKKSLWLIALHIVKENLNISACKIMPTFLMEMR